MYLKCVFKLFNIHSVAWTVLQTALYIVEYLTHDLQSAHLQTKKCAKVPALEKTGTQNVFRWAVLCEFFFFEIISFCNVISVLQDLVLLIAHCSLIPVHCTNLLPTAHFTQYINLSHVSKFKKKNRHHNYKTHRKKHCP